MRAARRPVPHIHDARLAQGSTLVHLPANAPLVVDGSKKLVSIARSKSAPAFEAGPLTAGT
jgi:hypothetical protein